MASVSESVQFDLEKTTLRQVNQYLHQQLDASRVGQIEILHPDGAHSVAVGVDAPVNIDVRGHTGYYAGGMNKQASITIHGNTGPGVGENIMSGMVRVKGSASAYAAASGHGGLVVIEGDTSSRCGISMKGVDIVVGGSVGHVSGFMAQAGTMVICGDAGAGLGDSLYEAVIYVRGEITSLGADAHEEPMTDADHVKLTDLLQKAGAGFDYDPKSFKRIASAKTLYHWNAEHPSKYG